MGCRYYDYSSPVTTPLTNRQDESEVQVQVIPEVVEDDMRTNNEAEVFKVSSTTSVHVENSVAEGSTLVDNSKGPWRKDRNRMETESMNGLYYCTDKPPPRITRYVRKSNKGSVFSVKRTEDDTKKKEKKKFIDPPSNYPGDESDSHDEIDVTNPQGSQNGVRRESSIPAPLADPDTSDWKDDNVSESGPNDCLQPKGHGAYSRVKRGSGEPIAETLKEGNARRT